MLSFARRFAVVGLLVASAASAATEAKPDPCGDPKSHQFDFWIGEWDVTSGGQVAGSNSITAILDGCVLQENWVGAGGDAGTSLNFYDPQKQAWRQLWVWRRGTTLELEGGLVDGKMVLTGRSVGKSGAAVENRITWTANADGTVRQLWESSSDSGTTWKASFDGLYRRKTGT